MCGGLLYLVTWPFQTRESLRARCGLWPPLADAECTWETPGRFSAWVLALVWVAVVIVALALFTAMAWWVDAVRLERRPRLPHWVPTTLAAVACASIAIEAVVIRQAYEHEWVTWAEGVTRIYGTPYVYPADQIAEGTRVFIPIAVVFAVAAIAFVALAVRAGRGSRRHEAAAPVVVQA
jgi:hypothetical protein